MKKADWKFNKDRKNLIDEQSKETEVTKYFRSENRPIYIPKRKKKK